MEKRHFYLESELDTAEFPIACLYQNDFLQREVFLGDQDLRSLNCVQNALLNLMVCGNFQSDLKPSALISKIKKAVPEATKGASDMKDLVSFIRTDDFFKDFHFTAEQPKLHRFLDILNDTEKVLITYEVKSGRHCSYWRIKDGEIYEDGVKIPLDLIVKILAGDTTFVVFLYAKAKEQI